jgi:hypothetical protein
LGVSFWGVPLLVGFLSGTCKASRSLPRVRVKRLGPSGTCKVTRSLPRAGGSLPWEPLSLGSLFLWGPSLGGLSLGVLSLGGLSLGVSLFRGPLSLGVFLSRGFEL